MKVKLNDVSVTYSKGLFTEQKALKDISITLKSGTVTGLIGASGSGKSTLANVIAGLLNVDTGTVELDNLTWTKKNSHLLRGQVGIVFQDPEKHLFADTVEMEVAFALQNFNIDEPRRRHFVREALSMVHLEYDKFANRSPFSLSGGEMKRLAIASTIVYKPELIIFDEPTAGLDSKGKDAILKLVKKLNKQTPATVLLVTHNMNEILEVADTVIVMDQGQVYMQGTPIEIFSRVEDLKKIGLDAPEITNLIYCLNQQGNLRIPMDLTSYSKLEAYLKKF